METLAIWTPGWGELLIVCIVALLLFGPRLPQVGRSLGRSVVEFKKGLTGMKDEIEADIDDEATDDKAQ